MATSTSCSQHKTKAKPFSAVCGVAVTSCSMQNKAPRAMYKQLALDSCSRCELGVGLHASALPNCFSVTTFYPLVCLPISVAVAPHPMPCMTHDRQVCVCNCVCMQSSVIHHPHILPSCVTAYPVQHI